MARDVAEVVLHRDHPLANRNRLTPRDLVPVTWVATPAGTICRQWLDRMYVGTGASPRIAHECAEFDSHLALVAAGLGVALVPRLGRAALPPEVVAVPVRDPAPERTVTVPHRRSMDSSPAVQVLLQTLLAVSGWDGAREPCAGDVTARSAPSDVPDAPARRGGQRLAAARRPLRTALAG